MGLVKDRLVEEDEFWDEIYGFNVQCGEISKSAI